MASASVDNLYQVWGVLVLAGLGIGGIVVPASIITTIICPDVSLCAQSLSDCSLMCNRISLQRSLP